MKKVFIFNENSRAGVYGIGTYINQVLTCNNSEDISISIVNLRSDKKEFTIEEKGSVLYFYIPSEGERTYETEANYKYYRNVLYILYPFIDKESLPLFHLNYNYRKEESLSCILKQRFPTCKIITTIHYLTWCFSLSGNVSYFKRILSSPKELLSDSEKRIPNLYKSEYMYFQSVDKIICLSSFTYNLLTSVYKISEKNIALIYNGLKDEGCILSEEKKYLLKKKYGIPTDKKIILFVGRLDEIKGGEYLIRAFKEVCKEYPLCHLIIVGDGEFSSYLDEALDCWGRMTFTGRLSKEKLYSFYQIADIGVMPSMHEQCSYVAMEMMMFSLPLIASDSTGLNEMVIDGENGKKISVKELEKSVDISIEELSRQLLTLLEMPDEEFNVMRKKSREMFESNYKLEIMKAKLSNLYRSL